MYNEASNTISLQVVPVPGAPVAVIVDAGDTIADAVREAGLTLDGYSVRRDGAAVDSGLAARNGDRIILSKQVKGNR